MESQNFLSDQEWIKNLVDGIRRGIAPSAENRRDALSAIRDLEGLDEPPRAVYTLYQNPIIDAVRQRNTYGNKKGIETLGLGKLTDDAILYRANNGLVAGPRPEELVPKELWLNNQALPPDPKKIPGESLKDYEVRSAPYRKVRERNLEIYKDKLQHLPGMTKAGHLLGSIGADLANDTTRGLWWLINASQAVTNLASEGVASVTNPDLFGAQPLNDLELAERNGLVRYVGPQGDQHYESGTEPLPNLTGENQLHHSQLTNWESDLLVEAEKERRQDPKNYVSTDPGVKKIRGSFRRRNFNPNLVNVAAMLPAAIGINSGIGLLGGEDSGTILPGTGRKLGYAATVPTENDPRKTENLALEAGSKYFLGREGRLLGWGNGFQADRPDVSKAEYNKYKGYEQSRDIDLNPLDGDFNLGGVLKGTTEGIHGPELQFLGKNIPLNEAIIPTAGAILGTAAGSILPNVTRLRLRKNNPNLRKYIPDSYYQRDKSGDFIRNKDGSRQLKEEFDWEAPDLQVTRYSDPRASRITKILGNMPEVIARDKATGKIIRNEKLAENKTLRGIENWFLQPEAKNNVGQQMVAPDQMRRDRVLGATLGSGLAGLILSSNVGAALEEERRRRNFQENNPGKDYEVTKNTLRKLGDRQFEIAAANNNRQSDIQKYGKTGQTSRERQESLLQEAAMRQAAVDEIANIWLRAKAQEELDVSIAKTEEAKDLEERIFQVRQGKQQQEEQQLSLYNN